MMVVKQFINELLPLIRLEVTTVLSITLFGGLKRMLQSFLAPKTDSMETVLFSLYHMSS